MTTIILCGRVIPLKVEQVKDLREAGTVIIIVESADQSNAAYGDLLCVRASCDSGDRLEPIGLDSSASAEEKYWNVRVAD